MGVDLLSDKSMQNNDFSKILGPWCALTGESRVHIDPVKPGNFVK